MKIFTLFLNIVRKITHLFGGVLISKNESQRILQQRSRLVDEYLRLTNSNYESGLSGIVFSKDRALQLYAMLESYFKYVENPFPLIIIYNAIDEKHEKSYRDVAKLFSKIKLVNDQQGFRNTLLSELDKINTTNLFFLTDDNIFLRKVNLKHASIINPRESVLSLRHSPRLSYNYTTQTNQKPPNFSSLEDNTGLLKFNWFEKNNQWSDPWSVDGHVYSTSEIQILSRISDFKAPNTYEAVLKTFGDLMINRCGLCYEKSIVLNMPINRVQDEVSNKSGEISIDFLLDKWNKGYKINTSIFENYVPKSTHEEHSIIFQKR